jgi:glycine cleavage system regulatory protein
VVIGNILSRSENHENMPYSLKVEGADKSQLVVSLAALLLQDSNVEVTAENLDLAISSSSNQVPSYYSTLFANLIAKAGGVEKFLVGPSAGGGMNFFLLCEIF